MTIYFKHERMVLQTSPAANIASMGNKDANKTHGSKLI